MLLSVLSNIHTHEATGSSPVASTKTHQIRTDLMGFILFLTLLGCVYFLVSCVTHVLTHTGIDLDRTEQHRTGSCRPVLSNFENYFLLHRLADDSADGVRCVLLHLCSGVGVGVEGEACGVVAQGPGKGFHIYAVLEGQGGEKMPHVVEPDVLRADGFQYFVVDTAEGIRVVHSAGFGRGEHVLVSGVLLVLLDQQVHRLLRDRQRSDGVLCFGRADYQFAVDSVDLIGARDRQCILVEVSP